MIERRPSKPDDQNEAEKAYQILLEAMRAHPEIEQTLWASACWSALVNGYIASGISYEEAREDWEVAMDFYKEIWNKDEL